MKNNRTILISIFFILLSIEVIAYNVNINWTFDKNSYDVELYRCTSSICNNYDTQLISTVSPGYTYNMYYTAEGTKYHAAFFYKSCYRPKGYIITTTGPFTTSVNATYVKKNYCASQIDPLSVTTIQTSEGTTVSITTDVKSAFTVSDDAAGTPKFYPESHRAFFTSDIKVKMLIDDNLVSEEIVPLYQDTSQTMTFDIDTSTLTPGTHTIKIQTDPVDCICDQNNKELRERIVEIQVEGPPENTPPTIEGLPDKTINEDTGYWNALIDLWEYAQDNETADSGLTFTITSQTNNTIADCIVDHNQYIDCATLPNMYGYSDVTVRVTDPEGLYDEDTFRITVEPVNDIPIVDDIPNQTINSCHQFQTFDLDNYVDDVDDTDQEITWDVSGNDQLTVAIDSNHIVMIGYQPGFIGSETIRFTATDPEGAQDYDDAVFTVTECEIPPTNTAPELDIPNQEYEKNSGLHTIDLHGYAHDAESSDDELTFTIINQTNTDVVNCVIRNNRYLDCTVQQNRTGYSDITVRVTDPEGLYDEDTFRVSVTEEVEPEKDPEVEPSIQIIKVVYDDHVKQGGYLYIDIYVQGNKVKNTEATITIPELGINEQFNTLRAIEIKIPEKADIGKHVMEITVKSNHNEQDNTYREFFIDPKNPEEGKNTATGNEWSTVTGSATADKYNNKEEAVLTLVAIALTIILIVILVLIIAALTTKNSMVFTTEKFI